MDIEYIKEIVNPTIEGNGCELWGIDLINKKNLPTIRIFIDAIGGATIQDCEKINTELNFEMPVHDLFNDAEYVLEVSTPGLDRKFFYLDQLKNYIGEKFLVKFKRPLYGSLKFSLFLVDIDDEIIIFSDCNSNIIRCLFSEIDKCSLEPDFEKILRSKNG